MAPHSSQDKSAFSLIELLVVVAIIGILAAVTIPAFNSIGQARGVTEAGFQLASAMDLARSEAVARQTYVWMAVRQTNIEGSTALRLGMVYSRDGTTNTSSTNLQPIGRVVTLLRTGLTNSTNGVDLSALNNAPAFNIGSVSFANAAGVLFTPGGEAMTNMAPSQYTGFTPLIGAELRQSKGTSLIPNNWASISLDGSTATPFLSRP
jgi:prepilin-type N-terminal cleavage/methylation domain-containing protein